MCSPHFEQRPHWGRERLRGREHLHHIRALDAIKLEREPYYIPPGDKYAAESYAVLQAP